MSIMKVMQMLVRQMLMTGDSTLIPIIPVIPVIPTAGDVARED